MSKKSPELSWPKKALTVYEKPCFSPLSCVEKKSLFEDRKFFVKREKQTMKFFDQLRLKRGIFTFLFSHNSARIIAQQSAEKTKRVKKFFGIRLVFTKWLVHVLFSHFYSVCGD